MKDDSEEIRPYTFFNYINININRIVNYLKLNH